MYIIQIVLVIALILYIRHSATHPYTKRRHYIAPKIFSTPKENIKRYLLKTVSNLIKKIINFNESAFFNGLGKGKGIPPFIPFY